MLKIVVTPIEGSKKSHIDTVVDAPNLLEVLSEYSLLTARIRDILYESTDLTQVEIESSVFGAFRTGMENISPHLHTNDTDLRDSRHSHNPSDINNILTRRFYHENI